MMPWSGARLSGAAASMVAWGICGWAFVVPQQHRLIEIAPQSATILLALYTMAVYAGSSASGIIGALALQIIEAHRLPLVGAGLILSGFALDEYGRRRRKRVPLAVAAV
jgi:predicted MFS family arabinose efflux permease